MHYFILLLIFIAFSFAFWELISNFPYLISGIFVIFIIIAHLRSLRKI